ncbi:hypothetical protein NUACC21_43740 [Scytonema sp. NUACC21]
MLKKLKQAPQTYQLIAHIYSLNRFNIKFCKFIEIPYFYKYKNCIYGDKKQEVIFLSLLL